MKNTLVLVTSNRDVKKLTSRALAQLVAHGAGRLDLDDVGDITLARNLGLTRALTVMMGKASRFDVLLCVDDDMLFTVDQAQRLVDFVRAHDKPASGAYVLGTGAIAAQHFQRDRWLTGCGFLAMHRLHLEKLAIESQRGRPTADSREWLFEFCTSGFRVRALPEGEMLVWEPEDFSLTRRLGGVVLLPMSLGHVKPNVMRPPEGEKLEAFINDIIAKHPPKCSCERCAMPPRFTIPPPSGGANKETES